MSRIWRKNFAIPRADLSIASETIPGWYNLQVKTLGKHYYQHSLWVYKNFDNIATYIPKNELREMARATLRVIRSNPGLVDRIHRETIRWNEQYFRFAEKIRKIKLNSSSDKRLLSLHKRLFYLQTMAHGLAQPTTWFVDSDGEDLSNFFLGFLRQRIKEINATVEPAVAFSVLTSSAKPTMAFVEEGDFLRILQKIQRSRTLKAWFVQNTPSEMAKNLSTLPATVKNLIRRHHYAWCWTPYTYLGPAYKLEYYLEGWKSLVQEKADPRYLIRERNRQLLSVQSQRQSLVRGLNLSRREKRLFDIAAEIIWLKGYRKDCYFHGFFVLDLLLAEIGRRGRLSLTQTKYLLPEELPLVLGGRDLSEVANDRMKFMVIFVNKTKFRIRTGKEAERFLKKQKIEKAKIVKTNELQGTCACPGKVAGRVKVINLPEDMSKMKKGDILLAYETYPALLPAMKKAAAIVTEKGGITCHAAIVAREMQIPCVVGCQNALANLKDGDRVSVDATEGIIRKL